jgi:hypothetical protein
MISKQRCLIAGAAASLLVLAGCSDSSDDKAAESSPSVDPKTTSACEALVKSDAMAAEPGSPEYAQSMTELSSQLQTIAQNTAGDVSAAATLAADKFGAAAQNPDGPPPFEDPEVGMASVTVHKWGFDECGYTQMATTVKESQENGQVKMEYVGVPADLESGVYAVSLQNTSPKEPHIMVIARKNPGVTDTTEAILAMPEEELFSKVTIVSGDAFAEPNSTGYLTADLSQPGEYIFLCPLTDDADVPHFVHGMHSDVTVT